MFESKSGVFLIAGIGFFALAFVSNGLVPILMYANLEEKSVEKLVAEQQSHERKVGVNVVEQFKGLHLYYRESFEKYYGKPPEKKDDSPEEKESIAKFWNSKCAEALRLGRKVYVGEGCWHCHSQFIRPVSNESQRWGPVSKTWEYQNELQRPVMFGTRRVGPDLSREGGRHGNDWHTAHFFRPRDTSPESMMPEYPWFFDGSPGSPNRRGIAIITYMQWLGSWLDGYPYYDLDKKH